MNFILGKKLNMSQYFDQATGAVFPVTIIKASPMVVTQIKEATGKDKYSAVQIGLGKKQDKPGKKSKISQAIKGHLKELGNFSVLAEFRVKDSAVYSRGQKLDVAGFQIGEVVDVVGTSKGRGFAGAMKRHGFAGFPASHGHNKPRSVGSIGQRWPQHVRKGMRMAGHMGNVGVTVKNLQVVEVDSQKQLISLKGAVPGHRNGFVRIISTGKVKPLAKVEEVKEDKKKK